MTVLLVLLTFAIFLSIDYWRHRKIEAVELARATEPVPAFAAEPIWVAGYQMPEDLHYHRGHTWVRPLDADTVLVGMDDFARRLIGKADDVELPAAGSWLRQGAKALRVGLGAREVDLVAPVEGEVLETNAQLATEPGLATADPYGRGWLMKVRSTELGRNLSNLLSGSLARRFMEDSRERLQHQLMALSGTVLADGGEPVADFARHLPEEDWRHLVHELLLG
ncbi:MAG: glycine cleavage system protein H [Acidobacteriota bacterium]